MPLAISKSTFKPKSLEFFRHIQETGEEIIITDYGKPVLKIVPYFDDGEAILASLKNSIISYENPLEPVGEKDWELLS